MTLNLSRWQTVVWDAFQRFLVIRTGRRSGKTVAALAKMIEMASKQKNQRIWYVAPTYRQAKNIAWMTLKQMMPSIAKPQWHEQELRVTLVNSSVIELKGADNPDSLRGTYVDFLVCDEVAFFNDWESTWQVLRPLLTDKQAPAWFISTPYGLNHFYDLSMREIESDEWKSFHYTSYDNPFIAKEELDQMKAEMSEDEYNQEMMAEFVRPTGSVYKEWPLENFCEVSYDISLDVHVSLDFGVNDPTAILWLQPSPDGLRVIDYTEVTDSSMDMVAQVLRSKPYKTPSLITGDAAGTARSISHGISPIDVLSSHGYHVRSTPGVEIPDQIRETHKIIKSLYVSTTLPHFRDVLLNYRYPEKRSTILNQSNEIPIHDKWSHGARALEYYVINSRGVLSNPLEGWKGVQRSKWTIR